MMVPKFVVATLLCIFIANAASSFQENDPLSGLTPEMIYCGSKCLDIHGDDSLLSDGWKQCYSQCFERNDYKEAASSMENDQLSFMSRAHILEKANRRPNMGPNNIYWHNRDDDMSQGSCCGSAKDVVSAGMTRIGCKVVNHSKQKVSVAITTVNSSGDKDMYDTTVSPGYPRYLGHYSDCYVSAAAYA